MTCAAFFKPPTFTPSQSLSRRTYDLTILSSTDFGYIQDDTRQSSEF